MGNILETIDSLNDENASEVKEKIKSEADALSKENKKLYVRAKKAEGFEYDKIKKGWVKKEPEKKPEAKEQSNEPNYSQIAFLEGRGIKHPDDQKIVQDETKRLKLPLTDILGMEHIKTKLKNILDQREAEAGMPDGSGQATKGSKDSVDYWVNKKTQPPSNLKLCTH